MKISDEARRKLGAGCVTVAVAMLAAGELGVEARLQPVGLLIYWFVAWAFGLAGAVVALWDAGMILHQSTRVQRHEERALWSGFLPTRPGSDDPKQVLEKIQAAL